MFTMYLGPVCGFTLVVLGLVCSLCSIGGFTLVLLVCSLCIIGGFTLYYWWFHFGIISMFTLYYWWNRHGTTKTNKVDTDTADTALKLRSLM